MLFDAKKLYLAVICELPDAEWRALSEKALQIASLYGWGDAVQRLEAALERAVAEA